MPQVVKQQRCITQQQVPTREGYVFAGWATSATSTTINWQPGDTVKFDSSKTLYAVWAVAQMRLNGVINYYSSLASAVNAATDNTEMTITMLVNRTEEPLEIPSNKSINLDLNNTTLECSITNRGTLKVSSGNINISSSYSNNFAIRNLGTAEITNGIYTVTGGNTLINEIGGTLNIKNGNFVNDGSGTNIYNNAVLNVYGGTFTSNQYGIVTASELSYDDIAISNISNVTINVKGTAIQSGNTNGNEIMARGISYVYNSILKGDESASYVVGDDKGSVIVLYDCTTQGAYKYNVTEVKTDSKGYDVYVYNVPSSYTIICPTWTTANGQDDMTWENATNMGNGTHHYRVDISRHNDGERGEYITTIYRWTNGAIVDGWQFTVNIP